MNCHVLKKSALAPIRYETVPMVGPRFRGYEVVGRFCRKVLL